MACGEEFLSKVIQATSGSQTRSTRGDIAQQVGSGAPEVILKSSHSTSNDGTQKEFQAPLFPARLLQPSHVPAVNSGSTYVVLPAPPPPLATISRPPFSSDYIGGSSKTYTTLVVRSPGTTASKITVPFTPLQSPLKTHVLNKSTLKSKTPVCTRTQAYKPKAFKAPEITRLPRTGESGNLPVPIRTECPPSSSLRINQCLDFPAPLAHTELPRISMPPSISRRRQAERMSVVFSGISDRDVLALCVQVSRAWRYAGE